MTRILLIAALSLALGGALGYLYGDQNKHPLREPNLLYQRAAITAVAERLGIGVVHWRDPRMLASRRLDLDRAVWILNSMESSRAKDAMLGIIRIHKSELDFLDANRAEIEALLPEFEIPGRTVVK